MQGCKNSSDRIALTQKQCEAIQLVAEGYTSKEAARLLSIAPKMVDRRIDAVRQKFGGVSRNEAARLFRADYMEGEFLPRGSSPLTQNQSSEALGNRREDSDLLPFADAGAHSEFLEIAPWDYRAVTPVPKIELARLGIGARLAMIGGGSLILAAIFLMLIGVANGLNEMLVS